MSGFSHRTNNDASVDSICLRCFRTIGSNNHEWRLAAVESQHECDPMDILRFEHLGTSKKRQIERIDGSDSDSPG
jgi:hypothetical protein